MTTYSVYIVRCADGSLYTGICTNIERRLAEHNSQSKGAKYTRVRQPITLVYSEKAEGRSEALVREYAIKQLSRSEKENLFSETARGA